MTDSRMIQEITEVERQAVAPSASPPPPDKEEEEEALQFGGVPAWTSSAPDAEQTGAEAGV